MNSKPPRLFHLVCVVAVFCATEMAAFAAGAFLGVRLGAAKGGVSVVHVIENGPAHGAGMKAGDIVTEMGGETVSSQRKLNLMLGAASPGDKVKFDILRAGEKKVLEVTLANRPPPPPKPEKPEGLMNVKAPEIDIKQWDNLPKGKTQFKLADYEGKTVFLYCFQSW